MKILLLVPGLPLNLENIKGGVNSATLNLLEGCKIFDINIQVISFTNEVKNKITIPFSSKINIIYIPEGRFNYHALNYLLIVPFKLRNQIKIIKPDLIHFEVGNSFMLSKLFGIYKTKYLLTIHGMSYDEAKHKIKIKDKIIWYFNGLIQNIMYPKYIIHLSNFSKKKFDCMKNQIFDIIPNAVPDKYFNIPIKTKTDNNLLYIGLIDVNKNILHLLKSLKDLISKGYKYTLNIVGDFYSKKYKNIISAYIYDNDLDNYIHFNGWVSKSELIPFIQKSDILVVCSMHESLPMVIAECMSSGKVVIASDVGGIPEMIKDNETGFLFSLNHENELTEKLIMLYDNNITCNKIANNARKHGYKYYNTNIVAKKTIDFYKLIINDQY